MTNVEASNGVSVDRISASEFGMPRLSIPGGGGLHRFPHLFFCSSHFIESTSVKLVFLN
jgi:hypothetical protein